MIWVWYFFLTIPFLGLCMVGLERVWGKGFRRGVFDRVMRLGRSREARERVGQMRE